MKKNKEDVVDIDKLSDEYYINYEIADNMNQVMQRRKNYVRGKTAIKEQIDFLRNK